MSSTLTLHPLPIDSSSGLGSCYNYSQQAFNVGKSTGIYLSGGLPTPPATADMSTASLSNGILHHRQPHQYLTEQRQTLPQTKDSRPQAYITNTTNSQAPSYYDRRPVNNYGYAHVSSNSTTRQDQQIATHLQIPESVNNSKGSLGEFAAQMTCLFWFETSKTLRYAESLLSATSPDRSLNPDAVPSIGFTKWVTTILSTTQVGKNVVLLALMFIYRLKQVNPDVSGKKGSEFRLLTIALMLGNKFLDDNTYTNKTWAEVSGISVNEIHIMEVEFLSNMRYNLYASETQWQEWKNKLGRLSSFYERALRYNSSAATSPTTPIFQTSTHKLPSPQSHHKHQTGHYTSLPNPMQSVPHLPRSPVRRAVPAEFPYDRKRSLDTSLDLPPAKRIHSLSTTMTSSPAALTPTSVMTPDSAGTAVSYEPPLRLPQLAVPTLPHPIQRNDSLNGLGMPSTRAMSSVYPSTASLPHPATTASTYPPSIHTLPLPAPVTMSTTSGTLGRNGSAHTSPTNIYGNSAMPLPGLSPSYFLMNRSSPYRPVRNVNTLLFPPPSAAMQPSARPIDYQQMHYQPLSKNYNQQPRPGPMPCLQPDAWQGQVSTPAYMAYRPY